MYKYSSKRYDVSPFLAAVIIGGAPFVFTIIILGVIGISKVKIVLSIILSFAVVYVLAGKLSWRELIIDDDRLVYVFKLKPFRIIDISIPWDEVSGVEFHPFIVNGDGGDWNVMKGLEPKQKLLRIRGKGNKLLLSTNITDFGQDAEIRKIIEDICERNGIPCRQMWKEWGKK